MAGKLILVRHGQTEANVARRLDTRLPGARLTQHGEGQALAYGTALTGPPPKAVVASEALRARQTASFVELASGITVQVREGIHEAQAGELEDRSDRASHELFARVFHSWHAGELGARIPGGESGEDILERYLPVVSSLRSEFLDGARADEDGDVLVVSHGAAIRLVARYLADVDGTFSADTHLDNTQTIELAPTAGGGWKCVRWGALLPPFFAPAEDVLDDPMG
ncbi:histidine phosphatase family protein [Rhodococcus sp. NPDC127528]|uniref:histidine phosphatase family protein n=1 Tax=unclassified Rhodococcus (in: high G+C Gram-positive bacteria) TaxID=192944 RepID=UPI0036375961